MLRLHTSSWTSIGVEPPLLRPLTPPPQKWHLCTFTSSFRRVSGGEMGAAARILEGEEGGRKKLGALIRSSFLFLFAASLKELLGSGLREVKFPNSRRKKAKFFVYLACAFWSPVTVEDNSFFPLLRRGGKRGRAESPPPPAAAAVGEEGWKS